MLRARAPGKLVVLGEYAVLDGAPALVMAVDRYCVAEIAPADGPDCQLTMVTEQTRALRFESAAAAGSAIVDLIRDASGLVPPPWSGRLDSSDFYSGTRKLGLGSSAAALVSWAGTWTAYTRACGFQAPALGLEDLVRLHRTFQGGAGSGLDVAAAYAGGLISYRLDRARMPQIGSVRLPNSVGFAGVFAGHSASTPDLVAHYRRWVVERPAAAAALSSDMGGIAARGLAAAGENDGEAFLAAVAAYGRSLDALGRSMGVEIMTPEHREIESEAGRCGVVYKVSGAGGGDVGLAFAREADALTKFVARVVERGFQVLDLAIDEQGMVVSEQAE